MPRKALITGITGQDGSYLADFLLEKGYAVFGLVRRSSSCHRPRIAHLENRLSLLEGDMTDFSSLRSVVESVQPDEVYNLAAMSHVKASFDVPEYTANVDGLGVVRLLEAIRTCNADIRFYQASTSELYGKVKEIPQNEKTFFYPRSPYGIAKLYAYWSVVNYREAYGLYACNGILFNHESPRRGEEFVSRKITLGIAKVVHGLQEKIVLGNLEAKRDWGYAQDFVEGMWLMLQQKEAQDYVLATGESHSVREFVEAACGVCGIHLEWEGHGIHEKGRDRTSGKILIEVSPDFFRPAEVDILVGDASKAKDKLLWHPRTQFHDLVSIMMEHDLKFVESLEKAIL